MRINVAVPEAHVTKPVLDAALEATTRLDEALIKSGAVPQFSQAVGRVRWKPEPPGQEHFDHAALVLGRGWGDCDDLAPWHAASLRATGKDRGARAVVKRSGPKRWHAVVQRSNGTIEDPSKAAGMGQSRGVNGAVLPVMSAGVVGAAIMRPQLAVRPIRARQGQVEAWQARADLPWHWQPGGSPGDLAMASLHASPVASNAIVGALRGAVRLGEESGFIDQDALDYAEALGCACEGAEWEEIAEEYGPEIADEVTQTVVGLFGGLKKLARKIARPALKLATGPLGQTALSFVPGVGPLAAQGLRMASPHLQRALAARRRGSPAPRGGGMPMGRGRGFNCVWT